MLQSQADIPDDSDEESHHGLYKKLEASLSKAPLDKGKTQDFRGSDLVEDINEEDITPEIQQAILNTFKDAMKIDKLREPIMTYLNEKSLTEKFS
ncbi:hypothetical protein Moror_13485 [Moniliophthora roreri MCA 2997]|uniref:Uncharacterized protein n=1 Tax=Moniliophthora roreri (strain MCA 2997) TaxID=1381753 RepID=V2WUI5_MONRO|nr:hypothetical protein Moror_13485 [Moniliophthora roreri MCA 2997]